MIITLPADAAPSEPPCLLPETEASQTGKGFIISPDGGELWAVGFIINCPVVSRVN